MSCKQRAADRLALEYRSAITTADIINNAVTPATVAGTQPEVRRVAIDVRAPDTDGELPTEFWARVVNYNVIDDYDTIFLPGCFNNSLEERMPRLTYGHDWMEVIGVAVEARDTDTGLDLRFQLDDLDHVPKARQAAAQLQSKSMDNMSVGFARVRTSSDEQGRTQFVEAILDECALVLRGAVPGTRILSMRQGQPGLIRAPEGAVIPAGLAADLLARLGAGDLTLADALTAAQDAATAPAPPPPPDPTGGGEGGDDGLDDVDAEGLGAEADAALSMIGA